MAKTDNNLSLPNRLRLKLHAATSRVMSSPRFMQSALWFWPTRLIARRQASRLFDLVSGFVYSQILSAAVRFDLFSLLKSPKSVTEVSTAIALTQEATARLLRATTALQLTKQLPANHYGLGQLGTSLVANAGLQALVDHHDLLYRDLCAPAALFSSDTRTTLGDYWAYSQSNEITTDRSVPAQVTAYSSLMAASQPMISNQVLACYSFAKHTSVLDVGGGTGRFLQAIRTRYEDLSLALFDLPAVNTISDEKALAAQRIDTHHGDFLHDPLPDHADLITLIRVLHDHDDEAVVVLLSRIHSILPENGTVLIAEPMSDTPGASRVGEAYFNLYFLAMGKGEPRSIERLGELLAQAGFTGVGHHRTSLPLVCSVITAQKKQ